VVDESARLQQHQPHDGSDGLGEYVRSEDDEPQEATASHPAIEQQRQADTERKLDEKREQGDGDVVHDRVVEDGVLDRTAVVCETHRVAERSETTPLEEAVVDRNSDRDEYEANEENERGPEEQ
jgi:hypothetical protein